MFYAVCSESSSSSTLISITSGCLVFLHIARSASGPHIEGWTMIGEPHDAQASSPALSPASLLTGASSSSLAALAVALLLRLVGLAFFFVGLSSPALSVAATSMRVSVLSLTSLDVNSVCGLTGLALATTGLLLASRGDGNSISIFGILRRRGVARAVRQGSSPGDDRCWLWHSERSRAQRCWRTSPCRSKRTCQCCSVVYGSAHTG